MRERRLKMALDQASDQKHIFEAGLDQMQLLKAYIWPEGVCGKTRALPTHPRQLLKAALDQALDQTM